jgi:hypothetical protein
MVRLRARAKRGHLNLNDANLIDITNFNTEFEIPIEKQLDNNGWVNMTTLKFTPEQEQPEPQPEPEEPPTGNVLYDSNTDIDWAAITGEFLKVDDVYGEFKPNAKYFRCKASGNPRAYLYPATKEIVLEHDGKYGRLYFGACNYESRLEGEFKLESCSHNLSLKTRNRHQYNDFKSGSPDNERQGGQGCSIGCNDTDADLEIFHGGGEVGGPSAKLSPKIAANEWFKVKFSQFDKDGKIHVIAEVNDKVVNEGDIKAPAQFFKKEQFESWSEFWVRLNADSGGKLYIKNLKLIAL